MQVFQDSNGGRVELTFGPNPFGMEARHVLIVLKHEGKWLLTKHRTRGIEFPGGKAEAGETVEEAAIRETFEETGVNIDSLTYIGEYIVRSNPPFCKAVFTAKVKSIQIDPVLHETEGLLWFTDEQLEQCEQLSFHMRNTGMDQLQRRAELYAE